MEPKDFLKLEDSDFQDGKIRQSIYIDLCKLNRIKTLVSADVSSFYSDLELVTFISLLRDIIAE